MNFFIIKEDDFNNQYNCNYDLSNLDYVTLNKIAFQSNIKTQAYWVKTLGIPKNVDVLYYLQNIGNFSDSTYTLFIYKLIGETFGFNYCTAICFKNTTPYNAANYFKLDKLKAFL